MSRKVFVYSGTGNSYATARQIAAAIDAQVVHITDELAEARDTYELEIGVIIYPVYGYGMPKTVKRFIRQSRFVVDYLAVLATFGSKHGGALAEGVRLLKRRGTKPHYTGGAKAVENYVHMFKLPPEERIEQICIAQAEHTNRIIADIAFRRTNKRFTFRPESSFVSWIFRTFAATFARRYKFTDDCTGCGICVRVCPANAIHMQDGKPKVVPKACDHCQACLQLCPKKAIRFGKIQPDGRRYCHVGVKLPELFKRDLQNDKDNQKDDCGHPNDDPRD